MVLFQVPLVATTVSTVSCPFYGKYKVKLLNIVMDFTTAPNPDYLIRINSKSLFGNFPGGQLIINTNPNNYMTFNSTSYEFITESINGFIDIALTKLDNSAVSGTGFFALLSFDFEKI